MECVGMLLENPSAIYKNTKYGDSNKGVWSQRFHPEQS